MAPVSLQELAVWMLPVVGGWVVMEFQLHPLFCAVLALPLFLGLLPKLSVFMLLLMRGVDKEKQREDAGPVSKRERLRRNLLALNIMGHNAIASTSRPLDLDRLSQSARSAPSSPRGASPWPTSPR